MVFCQLLIFANQTRKWNQIKWLCRVKIKKVIFHDEYKTIVNKYLKRTYMVYTCHLSEIRVPLSEWFSGCIS